MSKIVIGREFCGPPNSGNGGYVCGTLAKGLRGPVTSVLRAIVPLDTELNLASQDGANVLTGEGGVIIGKGESVTFELPQPPAAPSLEAARAAGARNLGLTQRVHPICFTCGPERQEGEGLRVFAGQLEGAPTGVVAGVWRAHEAFADEAGEIRPEVVWAALDCPGFFAWVEKEGRHGALLGTMTGDVLKRPKAGEECIVVAWPLTREGRKELSGVALYSAGGELMARGHQVWIVMGPPGGMQAKPAETAAA